MCAVCMLFCLVGFGWLVCCCRLVLLLVLLTMIMTAAHVVWVWRLGGLVQMLVCLQNQQNQQHQHS